MYDEHKTRIVREILLEPRGIYGAKLAPGRYIVDINNLGMDRSADVPKEIFF